MRQFHVLLCCAAGLAAQTTVTLNGNTYTLASHPRVWLDGPGGAFSASLQDSGGKANAGNPAYAALVAQVNAFIGSNICSTGANTYSGYQCPGANSRPNVYNMSSAVNAAFLWYAQGASAADPNGYLAAAIYGYEHFEDFASGSFACDESKTYCNARSTDIYTSLVYDYVWTGFSIIRAQWIAQKGSGEVATFARKVLNDNDTSHNGIGVTGCTNITPASGTGTISVSGNVVTGSGTSFLAQLSAGSVLLQSPADGGAIIGTVYSVTSDTQVILTTSRQNTAPSGAWRYAGEWNNTNCGAIFFMKHHQDAPPLIPGQESGYSANYAPSGGQDVGFDNNISQDCIHSYVLMALALADDNPTAGALLTEAYNWYYSGGYTLVTSSGSENGMYPLLKAGMTGFGLGGGYYYYGTWQGSAALTALSIRNSVVSGPDLTAGNYLAVAPAFTTMMALPTIVSGSGQVASFDNWENVYASAADLQSQARGSMEVCGMSPSDPYCPAFYQWLRGRSDYTEAGWIAPAGTGEFLPWYFVFNDPTIAAASLPVTQFVFKTPDVSAAECATQFPSSTCPTNMIFQGAISKSDWTSTATQLMIRAGFTSYGQDHAGTGGYESGSYHLFKGGKYLAAGDSAGYDYILDGENTILIGNAGNWNQGTGFAPITRWAGSDFTGVPASQYVYAMVNLAPSYTSGANVTAASREVIHSKPSSRQDYVITYDGIALSSGSTINAYHHYALNGGPSTNVTYTSGGLTVSSNQTTARLNTAILPVTGVDTVATNNTYPDANGYTVRITSCPEGTNSGTCSSTATSFEEITVEQPCNGTGCTMPTITQPSCTGMGGNCTTAQIADSGEARVAMFARQGALLAGASFTTTHSGTGQYIVAGLAAGTYTVTVGGSAVTGSPFTVPAGDTTLNFTSTAGNVQLSGGSSIAPAVTSKIVGNSSVAGSVVIR